MFRNTVPVEFYLFTQYLVNPLLPILSYHILTKNKYFAKLMFQLKFII